MAFSKNDFIDDYLAETKEHCDNINTQIIEYKSNEDAETLSSILRELHTIKGTSHMMGFTTIESVAHGMEDVFKTIRDEQNKFNDQILQLTFITTDCILLLCDRINSEGSDVVDVSRLKDVYSKISSGLMVSDAALEAVKNSFGKKQPEENSESEDNDYVEEEKENLDNIKSVRVDIEKINGIIRQFDNLIIRQFRVQHEIDVLEAEINSAENSQIKMPNQLKEELALLKDIVFKAQHEILNLRMMPLDIVLTPLKKEIQLDCIKLNKNVVFEIPKTEYVLDKAILEQLKEILLHLIRNSIDHGIESKEERIALGKPEQGKITVGVSQLANHIEIVVEDDGRGVQYEKIREKALFLFPAKSEEISQMSEKELQQFLFTSGFSTAKDVSELSGRGVGLDVVRSDMEKIKGKIHIETEKNKGTCFRLTIPLSLATQQGLFVYSCGMKFMIPSHYVQEIVDASENKISTIRDKKYINLRGTLFPLYHLSSIIGSGEAVRDSKDSSVIIVEYLETQMAIIVEYLEEYQDVVVNPLPPIFNEITTLQGFVFDENYSMVPILNIPEIMQRLKGQLVYDIKKFQSRTAVRQKHILVVDDSKTTREIEKAIFEAANYVVESASDGIEALEKMQAKSFDAIITDIKMPRMDGSVLLNNIRHIEEYKETPVIVVSGVYDTELQKEFMKQGANKVIVKSEFQRGNLLQAVKEFLRD